MCNGVKPERNAALAGGGFSGREDGPPGCFVLLCARLWRVPCSPCSMSFSDWSILSSNFTFAFIVRVQLLHTLRKKNQTHQWYLEHMTCVKGSAGAREGNTARVSKGSSLEACFPPGISHRPLSIHIPEAGRPLMEPVSGWHRGPGRHFRILGAQGLHRDPAVMGTFGADLQPLEDRAGKHGGGAEWVGASSGSWEKHSTPVTKRAQALDLTLLHLPPLLSSQASPSHGQAVFGGLHNSLTENPYGRGIRPQIVRKAKKKGRKDNGLASNPWTSYLVVATSLRFLTSKMVIIINVLYISPAWQVCGICLILTREWAGFSVTCLGKYVYKCMFICTYACILDFTPTINYIYIFVFWKFKTIMCNNSYYWKTTCSVPK